MRAICFYFQVHQPWRLKRYRFFNIGNDHIYLDDEANRAIMQRVARQCYLPMNALLLKIIERTGGAFRCSFSISGMAIEQFRLYAPEVLESFRRLAKSGSVEFLGETYSHSLSSLVEGEAFESEVLLHRRIIEEEFGLTPTTFRNTELIYSNDIGKMAYEMGFSAILAEGARGVLDWRSPNYVYSNASEPQQKLLLRNFGLSDDVAFRYESGGAASRRLTAEEYLGRIESGAQEGDVVNLFMDYETFGEHHKPGSGIFSLFDEFAKLVCRSKNLRFMTLHEASQEFDSVGALDVPFPVSWADEARDVTAWLGNELQNEAFTKLYELAPLVDELDSADFNYVWRFLQSSDHFYYMAIKRDGDAQVHNYFNPYESPYDAFINYMNILSDFSREVKRALNKKRTVGCA